MNGDTSEILSRPDSKAGRLQRECLALYREHESDGAIPTSGRFLFYELEDRRIVPKAYRKADGTPRPRTPAQDISDALTHLREVGLIPWEDIVDETRTLDSWAYAGSVVEFLLKEVSFARIDVWDGEEPPLILCESRSLAGALWSIAAEYLCPIASTNGQAGGFLHTSVAPLVKAGRRVFYLGDHDLSGGHIEENTRRVLERYGELEWEKIAITDVQVREHGYEADAVEKKDRRYKPPRVFWAVETERLGQLPLMRLLREKLDAELSERGRRPAGEQSDIGDGQHRQRVAGRFDPRAAFVARRAAQAAACGLSLAPDSAERVYLTRSGRFFSARSPVTMVVETTGSVGVTTAPTSRATKKGKPRIRYTSRPLVSHMSGITNPHKIARDRQPRKGSLLGRRRATPISEMASVSRAACSSIVFSWLSQLAGSSTSSAAGPSSTPTSKATRGLERILRLIRPESSPSTRTDPPTAARAMFSSLKSSGIVVAPTRMSSESG